MSATAEKRPLTPYRVARLKAAHWAIVRKLKLDDDARHELYQQLTGKASFKELAPGELELIVAALQRKTGQHADDFAHVRPHNWQASEGGALATLAQCAEIKRLAWHSGIEWRAKDRGLELLIRKRILTGAFRQQRWDGMLDKLFRGEATTLIRILVDMAQRSSK